MQADILNLERMISRLKREKAKWIQFRDKGSKDRSQQISLLEKELADMGQSFAEMAGKSLKLHIVELLAMS